MVVEIPSMSAMFYLEVVRVERGFVGRVYMYIEYVFFLQKYI